MAARFQVTWLNSPEFKDWIQQVPDDVRKARCLKCHKTFALSNMGHRALKSHAKGAEHIRRYKDGAQFVNIASLFSNMKNETLHEVTSETPVNASSTISGFSKVIPECPKVVPGTLSSSELCNVVASPNNSTMKTFIINNMVMKAKIKWCLQTIMCHKSVRSASAYVVLLKTMFPDSQIAQQMQLQRTKIGYSILYGISRYFKDDLLSKLTALKCYTVGFDKSLNHVSQRTQMDTNVRFWDFDKSEVCIRYLISVFKSHYVG
ncbi:hypothetical protein AVEN_49398-1 [Araneus ventricosus]|uniref:BED-type domain-containing protein n=1 Tax=Araneus ventricosus TaxID=182803 RepID=A0A4Y2CQQ9_ARAVE|nr:hypothetical protein AVEN_49398-1 [Araneus ventricosus]